MPKTPALFLYRITIERNAQGQMQNFNIVAPDRTSAEEKACELAGVDPHDPHTSQKSEQIHAVIAV